MLLNQDTPFALIKGFDRFALAELKPGTTGAIRMWREWRGKVAQMTHETSAVEILETLRGYLDFADKFLAERGTCPFGSLVREINGYKAMAAQLQLFLDPASMTRGNDPKAPAIVVFDNDGHIGVVSENGLQSTLSGLQRSQWPELPRTDLGAAAPDVITG